MSAVAGRGDETTSASDVVARWHEVDPVVICPQCWPLMAASWRARLDVTVRTLGPRPAWARCGVCDPEGVC